MARKKSDVLTPAEQRIMHALWSLGRASVGEVLDVVTRTRPTAYTTVMTVLKVLEAKGYVEANREGRAAIYQPLVSREVAQAQAIRHVVGQFFGGSPTALAQQLLRREDISHSEIEALEMLIQAAKDRHGTGDA